MRLMFFSIVLFPGALNALEIDTKQSLPESLQVAMVRYYEAENVRNWKITYSMRSELFRSTVPFKLYAGKMNSDMGDWKLVKLTIESFQVINGRIATNALFMEAPISIMTPSGVSESKASEATEWAMENGQWTCLRCGVRFRMSLNERIVE